MGKYMYRSQLGYERGQSVKCKDPNCTRTKAEHIAYGSKHKKATKYISCTTSASVALIYSLGKNKKQRTNINREPVLLIDAEKLAQYQPIYDTSEEPTKSEISCDEFASKYAPASREVLTEIEIPEECIREMPVICVDMVRALEATPSRNSEAIIETINDSIMSDDPRFKEIFARLEMEDELKKFYEEYYENGNTNLTDISNKMFGGDVELANCARVQVIKEVFKSIEMMAYLTEKTCEREGRKFVIDKHFMTTYKKIADEYTDVIGEELQMTAEMTSANMVIQGGLAVKVKSEGRVWLPSGVSFTEQDGKRIAIKQFLGFEHERADNIRPIANMAGREVRVVKTELPEQDFSSRLQSQLTSDEEFARVDAEVEKRFVEVSEIKKKPVDIIE